VKSEDAFDTQFRIAGYAGTGRFLKAPGDISLPIHQYATDKTTRGSAPTIFFAPAR
jgi:hypothetical protein